MQYLEQENGFLLIDGKSIPTNSLAYEKAWLDIEDGDSTIDPWVGSERESDAAKVAANDVIIAALEKGDQSIIRAIVSGETARVDAWKIEASALRDGLTS